MAWIIDVSKNLKKYRIYSTVADGFITDWMTKKQIKEYHKKVTLKRMDEDYKHFPRGWMGMDDKIIK